MCGSSDAAETDFFGSIPKNISSHCRQLSRAVSRSRSPDHPRAHAKIGVHGSLHLQGNLNSMYLDGGAFLDGLTSDIVEFPMTVWDEVLAFVGNLGVRSNLSRNYKNDSFPTKCYQGAFSNVYRGKYLVLFQGKIKQYYRNSCQFRLGESITLKAPDKMKRKDGERVNLMLGYIEVEQPGYIEFTYNSHFRTPMKVKTVSLLAVDECPWKHCTV